MSDKSVSSPRRRKLLAGVGTGVIAYGAGVSGTAAQSQSTEEVQVVIDNVDASAWEVTSVDGDDDLAETGVENPELTLREGVRYTFQNEGWSTHRLAFRSADGEALLTQSTEGSFEGDSETNWVDQETSVSFTVTGELAAELDNYVCTVHGSMEGSIRTVQEQGSDAPAAAEFSDQSTDGTAVTVDSVRLDDGGFVTIHDSTLPDGEPLASVRGTSEYLEPGSVENLEIELDDPLEEGDTLFAMPHRDSNGSESYDFVDSGANADPPYMFDGDAVLDDADVQVEGSAAVRIDAQVTGGGSVNVNYARLDDGGFVTIHDSTLLEGEAVASVRGTSEYLEPGSVDDLVVELDEPLEEADTLIAMPHRDSNGNESYDFVDSGASADPPYTQSGEAVIDDAQVQLSDATVTVMNQATASSTFTQEEPTAPGVAVDVVSNVESAVAVTYEDGEDLVIAGADIFGAGELDGESNAVVPVEDTGGFPGEHTAHAIPTDSLPGELAPGDTVSSEVASAVLDNDSATIHQGELVFDDQSGDGAVESGDSMATVDVSLTGDVAYTVDVHVTDDEGSIVGDQWIGSSNVLTGENEGAEIIAERTPEDGEYNELPFSGTDEFIAMIHVANDDSEAGDSVSPGSFPVLANIDGGSGAVPGGVTAAAEVTAEAETEGSAGSDDDGMDGGDNMSSEDTGSEDSADGSSDGSGPGFGPVAGAAGLSGLAAYAYRKLTLDSEPATPADDGIEEDTE